MNERSIQAESAIKEIENISCAQSLIRVEKSCENVTVQQDKMKINEHRIELLKQQREKLYIRQKNARERYARVINDMHCNQSSLKILRHATANKRK